ncbi:hypothetical protein RchiOBHm_Chr5g0076441 [Rosa chinensis]|uniref:Uncharacterized protein n=1 Tax=Rosa chinensis TaxID=74649 RepID=A0A2P6QLS1_ROSCH|nr:hypothetical protein RchiOBHm_Chr5g0076441 [Rosa chinensis]
MIELLGFVVFEFFLGRRKPATGRESIPCDFYSEQSVVLYYKAPTCCPGSTFGPRSRQLHLRRHRLPVLHRQLGRHECDWDGMSE